ncbi:MAG TPA: type II secretion system protein GspK [Gemmatimonadales bacterium]
MTGRTRSGVALVIVLGLLIVLGTVAGEVVRAVRLEAHTVASLRARTVGRYAAESGIALAEQRLRTLLDSVASAPDRIALLNDREPWLAPLREVALGDARFGVTVADLNARLDLNHSDTTTLRNLFARFTGESRAAAIATAIREAPLARLGELSAIPGVDPALALAVAPYVTVSGDGAVNVNSAPEPVLASLPALGEAGARNLVQRRESGERFLSYAELRLGAPRGAPPSGGDDVEAVMGGRATRSVAPAARLDAVMMPTRLLVISRGWQVGHPLTHEIQAVYAIIGSSLRLVSLQERDR